MNAKNFAEAINEMDSKYIDEALCYKKKARKHSWAKWGALAACLCLMLTAVFSAPHLTQPADPVPPVQSDAGKQLSQAAAIDEEMTLEAAQRSKPFGSYMPSQEPAGFHPEIIRRYQNETADYLSGLWTKGEGSYDEISWRVSFFDDSMERRVTSVEDRQNYDMSLYAIPLSGSVPEDLIEVVDHPIFNIDELTLDAVNRRAYTIDESGDAAGVRISLGVRYGDVVVEITAKGVSPEWIYDQLVSIK